MHNLLCKLPPQLAEAQVDTGVHRCWGGLFDLSLNILAQLNSQLLVLMGACHANGRCRIRHAACLVKAALYGSAAGQVHVAAPADGRPLFWQASCAQCLSTLASYTSLSSARAGRHPVSGGLAQCTLITCQHATLPLPVDRLHQ